MFVDLAQLESSVCVIGEYVLGFQMNHRNPENRGNRHPVYAPHGAYRCKGEDSWLTLAVTSDEEWERVCEVMGMPELAADPRFADLLSRHERHDDLDEIITGWTRDRAAHDCMKVLRERGVPAAPVLSGEGIFNDPHHQERGLLEMVDHPSTGPYFLPTISWKMSRSPGLRAVAQPHAGAAQ